MMLAFIALVSHFVACGWYVVGTLDEASSGSWVECARQLYMQQMGGEPDTGYYYATSLHWSLTQFTPASMEVVPVTTNERVYTIAVLLFGLITFSCLVSSITSSMTRLRSIHADEVRKVKDVQRYIRENHVSLELGALIFNFVREQRRQNRRRLHLKDVDYLAQLPELRKKELHVEVFATTLLRHPLYSEAERYDELWIVEVCHTVFTEDHIPQDQRLFSQDDEGKSMWFLSAGRMAYYGRQTATAPRQVLDARQHSADRFGCFIAEVVLWCPWRFWGRMVAQDASDVLMLDIKAFHRSAKQTVLLQHLQTYARRFVLQLPMEKALAETTVPIEDVKLLVREAFGEETDSIRMAPVSNGSSKPKGVGARLLRALSKVQELTGQRRHGHERMHGSSSATPSSFEHRPSTKSESSIEHEKVAPRSPVVITPYVSVNGAKSGTSRRTPSLQILFSEDGTENEVVSPRGVSSIDTAALRLEEVNEKCTTIGEPHTLMQC